MLAALADPVIEVCESGAKCSETRLSPIDIWRYFPPHLGARTSPNSRAEDDSSHPQSGSAAQANHRHRHARQPCHAPERARYVDRLVTQGHCPKLLNGTGDWA